MMHHTPSRVLPLLLVLTLVGPARGQCQPEILGAVDTPGCARDVAVSGNIAYVADDFSGLQVINVSNPLAPVIIGAVNTPSSALRVTLSGTVAYVADQFSGLQVIDVTVPEAPQIIGAVGTPSAAFGVALSGNTAYVADGLSGLQVIDVTNPAAPVIIGAVDTPGAAIGVAVSGTVAYVADGGSGLQVIDVTNPAAPVIIGAVDTPDEAVEVTLSGNVAYVADLRSGLQVIDVTNPAAPVIIGAVDTPGDAVDVTRSGNIAYVADFGSGLRLIDVSNPAMPQSIGFVDTPDEALGVAVSGTVAYVADCLLGLLVIDVSCPPLVVSCPDPVALEACAPQDEIDAAFDAWIDGFVFADGCDPLQVTFFVNGGPVPNLDGVSATDACGGVLTIVLEVLDNCGVLGSCGTSFSVAADTTIPVLTLPNDVKIPCGDPSDPSVTGFATASDACAVAVSFSDIVIPIPNACPVVSAILRSWTATDACGNGTLGEVQTIYLLDTEAPVLTVPADVTVQCDQPTDHAATGMATATDDCSDPAITHLDEIMPGNCPHEMTILRTWTATDGCDQSSSAVQTITIVDMTGPLITCPADVTVSCTDDTSPAATGMATAIDNCDDAPAVDFRDDVIAGNCPQNMTIERTWTAVDACGNGTTCLQVITVEDMTAPVITCPPVIAIQGAVADPAATGTATATDDCDDAPVITFDDECIDARTIQRTWTATGACDNSSQCVQTITQQPVILGVEDMGSGDSQLFRLNVVTGALALVGPVYDDLDMEGITCADGMVLGVSGGVDDPDDLVDIDFATGVITVLVAGLDLGMEDTEVTAMATDIAPTTWIFIEEIGFATIDIAGNVTLQIASDIDIQGLAVSPGGQTLWGVCTDGSLHVIDVGSGMITPLADLSDFVEGESFENLTRLSDDELAFVTSDGDDVEYSIYTISTGMVTTTLFEDLGPMDVEGIVFAPSLQCPFGGPVPLVGACCMADGTCEPMSIDGCAAMGGEHMGEGTGCQESAVCGADPLPGACCLADGSCVDLLEPDCVAQSGEFQVDGVPCDDIVVACPVPCPGDMDGDGVVGVADLVVIIAAWGTDDPAADLDGDGIVAVNDLVAIIAAWGTCP